MHYTLATGDICSKQVAARYVLTAFPQRWHRLAQECLRIRAADLAGPASCAPSRPDGPSTYRAADVTNGRCTAARSPAVATCAPSATW